MSTPQVDEFEGLRLPPHSNDAEQAVLGGIFIDNNAWLAVEGRVSSNDFFREDHRIIFRALSAIAAENHPLDVITVSEWMKGRSRKVGHTEQNFLQIVGGLAYLGTLAKDTPSAANVTYYAQTVRNYSIKRQLISASSEIIDRAFNQNSDDAEIKGLLEKAATSIFDIEQLNEQKNKGFVHIKSVIKSKLDQMQTIIDNPNSDLLGAASGLTELDNKLSGFERQKVYIIGGRPGMGKTTLGLNIAEGVANASDDAVLFFSVEMPKDQVAEKMIASQGGVDFGRIRNPKKIEESDWGHISTGVSKIAGMEFYIDDSSTLTPAQVRTRCRRLIRDTGKKLGLILLDYVQLMSASGEKQYMNPNDELKSISREIASIAKDFDCPVVLLSQLNRSVENRPNKRPQMADLRESGALEQDASVIIFVYRDDQYNEESPDKGIAELIIAKQRGGTVGTVRCAFEGHHQRFKDLTHDYQNSSEGGY